MLMLFIKEDPEEEEEQEEEESSNGATEEASEADEKEDGVTLLERMVKQIEAARQDALAMYGTDKNKYAMAIESYTAHMKDEEEKSQQTALQQEKEAEKESETAAEAVEV